jgi:hypothetical protein
MAPGTNGADAGYPGGATARMIAMTSDDDATAGPAADADFEIVSGNPAMFYATPSAIGAADDISTEQKLRLLAGWGHDITDRLTASGEGMTLAAGQISPVRAVTLEDVHAAIASVEASDASPAAGVMRTLWRRLTGSSEA